MLFIITTAGFDRESPCYLEHERAERILTGVTEDDSYFAIIYTLDPGDDYTDKSVWIKANPNLGVSVYEEYLESMVGQAIDSPTKTNTVLTKNFNVWTQANTRWLNYEKWASANTDVFDVEDLTGRRCWAGLDLSTTTDLTAFVLNFPPERDGEKHKKIYHFFLPEENIVDRERRDGVPYRLWAQMGWIHLTPGNVIDYDWIEHVIEQEGDRFLIQEIAFDPYNATEIVNHLSEKGFTLVQFRQGYLSMNPACKEYERLVLSGKFATNNNPIMNWMVNNVEVTSDPAGNIKPTKPKHGSAKRIDGVVADIMATWRTVENISEKESVYETRGLRVI
jgi:phage terminase large subunit-like protein